MPIAASEIQDIESFLASAPASAAVFAELRRKFPNLSWSRCDASDVEEEPFRTIGGFDLHLLDTRDHCPTVVSDPATANGLILATRNAT